MKVYVMPADLWGCGHYRLIWPAAVLRSQGHEVVIVDPNKTEGFLVRSEQDRDGNVRVVSLDVPDDADVIVLQRPSHRLHPYAIQVLRQNGIAVVVDMDDDMSAIHRKNQAWSYYNRKSDSSWKISEECCALATLVTTSTPRLQQIYAKHHRGVVLNNYVPGGYLQFDSTAPNGVFGWAGSIGSHPDDLSVVGRSVSRIAAEGFTPAVVGDGKGVADMWRLGANRDKLVITGTIAVGDWVRVISETLQVGMAPLAASAFNISKSRLKVLEMMSVGVPVVASPRAEYFKEHKLAGGAILLAETEKEWERALRLFLTNEAVRNEAIQAGKAYATTQTYDEHAWKWWEAWETALNIERGTK